MQNPFIHGWGSISRKIKSGNRNLHPQIYIVYHLVIRFAKNTRLLNVTFSHYWVHSVRWQIEIKKLCLPFYLRKEGDGKFNLQLFTVILLACDANPK